MDYSKVLAQEFDIKEEYAQNVIALLDDGNTIPFIARYRKEMHGSMDDQLIRAFSEKLDYLRGLDKRREEIRGLIEAQEKLTDAVSQSLDKAQTLSELEDIYRPFKPKRKTRASVAKEKGLEPLALVIIRQEKGCDPNAAAADFVNEEKGVNTPEEAIAGAMDIIAEQVSDSAEIRKRIREIARKQGVLRSVAADAEQDSVCLPSTGEKRRASSRSAWSWTRKDRCRSFSACSTTAPIRFAPTCSARQVRTPTAA